MAILNNMPEGIKRATDPEKLLETRPLENLPDKLKKFSKEMRKIRMNQKWSSYEQVLAQCRRVELKANSPDC